MYQSLAPVKRIRIHNPTAPPVSDETKQLMAARRRALRDGDTDLYRIANRGVKAAIRRDSRESIGAKISEQGPSSVWRNIRPIVAGRSPKAVLSSVGPDEITLYFVQVGPRVAREIQERDDDRAVSCRLPRVGACAFSVMPVNPEPLPTVVFSLRDTSACGIDRLTIKIVKHCFDVFGPVLQHAINNCVTRNDFPAAWKHSLVRPIYKSGDPAEPSNYRPISIVPVSPRSQSGSSSVSCIVLTLNMVFVIITRLQQHWLAVQMPFLPPWIKRKFRFSVS